MIAIGLFSYLFFVISISSNLVSTQPSQYQSSFNPQTIPINIQPSNNNPYYQPTNVQTATINPQSLQETLNQLVFGIANANPSIQGLVDNSAKIVGQNPLQIPKTNSNNDAPRVINNYFIVPPEFFDKNGTLAEKIGQFKRKRVDTQEIDVNKALTLEKDVKRRKHGIKSQKLQNIENAKVILDDTVQNNDKSKRRKKLKSRKTKDILVMAPDTEIISIDDVGVVRDEPIRKKKKGKSKRRKSKPKVVENKSTEILIEPILDKKTGDEAFGAVSVMQEDIPKRKKRRRNKTKVTDEVVIDDSHLKNIEEPVDNLDNFEGEIDLLDNRKTRNSRIENQRKEVRDNGKKINPIPDDILKAYFPYMNFYQPNNLPFNYNQYYQNINPLRTTRQKKRRNNVKVVKPPNDTIEITVKSIPAPKEPELRKTEEKERECKETVKEVECIKRTELSDNTEQSKTDKPFKDVESFEPVTDPPKESPQKINNKNDEIITKENYAILNENIEDLENYINPEIDVRSTVPVVYNNVINDYFPIFYDESVYSNEYDQAATTRSEKKRYFYNTEDKKHGRQENRYSETNYIEKDAEIFIPSQRKPDSDNLRNSLKESTTDLKFDPKILEKYTENPKIEEPIFQTPPFLEIPDFITKNVREYAGFKDSNNLENKDKLSVYSSSKMDSLPDIKRVRIPGKNIRPKVDEIETVFANSKVKKYGVQSESNESEESNSVSRENNEFEGNGETTYVVAKSMG